MCCRSGSEFWVVLSRTGAAAGVNAGIDLQRVTHIWGKCTAEHNISHFKINTRSFFTWSWTAVTRSQIITQAHSRGERPSSHWQSSSISHNELICPLDCYPIMNSGNSPSRDPADLAQALNCAEHRCRHCVMWRVFLQSACSVKTTLFQQFMASFGQC